MKVQLDKRSLDVLDRLRQKLTATTYDGIANTVKELALESAEQMVFNLSETAVEWSSGIFVVGVQTGRLRAGVRVEYPFMGDPYTAYVFNNTEYAQTIEQGETGEDKKRRLLLGGSKAKENKEGRLYKRIPKRERGDLTSFWTLTEDSALQDQEPRPFAAATGEGMEERAKQLLGKAFVEVLTP